MTRTLTVRHAVTVLTIVLAWTILGAVPAQAHTPSPRFHTRLVSLQPALPGLSVKVADNGEWVTLSNTSATAVVVYGYEKEPYLQIGPEGVWQNLLSPSTYLNQSLQVVPVPALADSEAPARWIKLSSSTTGRWHDQRIRWMGGAAIPAVVQSDLLSAHLVNTWTIRALQGGTPITITGTLSWSPDSGALYILVLPMLATGLIAVAAVFVPRMRRRRLRQRAQESFILMNALSQGANRANQNQPDRSPTQS